MAEVALHSMREKRRLIIQADGEYHEVPEAEPDEE